MSNLLQRMPQSAKVALVAALLVGAVATWYFGVYRPSQVAQQPAAPTPTPAPVQPGTAATPGTPGAAATPGAATPGTPGAATTARPLEVLPLPFLVSESNRPANQGQEGNAQVAAAPAQPRVTVPPNPFVPLIVETAAPPVAAQPAPAIVSRPTPSPVAPPVAVRPIPNRPNPVRVIQPAQPLPQPRLPGTEPARTPPGNAPVAAAPRGQARLSQGGSRGSLPGAISLGAGSLPIRLTPLDRELAAADSTPKQAAALDTPAAAAEQAGSSGNLDFARAEIDARVAQVLEPRSDLARGQDAVQQSGLARYVREQNLKLSGVVLGPTSVAIFQSKDGFVVLPVGRTLPGSDVLLKSLSAKEALLVQGSESLNLTIDNP